MLAVERREFQRAVDVLLPHASEIDAVALVGLALALDSLERREEAMRVLEARGQPTTDALGVCSRVAISVAWLTERSAADFDRARKLVIHADCNWPDAAGDHDQAYYHAVNVAFLDLMMSNPDLSVPPSVIELATVAGTHCAAAAETHWRVATQAEVALMRGELDVACALYARAIKLAGSPRAIDSMYTQAVQVASRVHKRSGVVRIEAAFGLSSS